MEIADNKTIDDLQQKFSDCFSLLKMEFFPKSNHKHETYDEIQAFPSDSKLEKIRTNHEHGEFEFFSHTKTDSFETELRDKFGLNVQVFRKQDGEWQQTTGTESLTLGEQQKLASLQAAF